MMNEAANNARDARLRKRMLDTLHRARVGPIPRGFSQFGHGTISMEIRGKIGGDTRMDGRRARRLSSAIVSAITSTATSTSRT
jgi:hypothetical protein